MITSTLPPDFGMSEENFEAAKLSVEVTNNAVTKSRFNISNLLESMPHSARYDARVLAARAAAMQA